MDGYIIGFIAISAMSLLISVMAMIFISFDGEHTEQDRRVRYTQIKQLTTNTIQTVNISGDTEVWTRGA